MVSGWGIDSYFNIERIQVRDIEIMISAYGLSGLFGSIVRFKSIGNDTYTGRRSNFRSKPTPIHVLVHKSCLNYSYSRSHFSRLPQAVSRKIICSLSQKFSNASKIIDPVINGFIPNDESGYFHICDHSFFTFGIIKVYIGLSNISHVDPLDRFRRSVDDKVKTDLCILKQCYDSK